MQADSHGEQIVGDYHRLITDCEIVSFNQRSDEEGAQTEIDVIAVNTENGTQTVYVCEVITHLHGTIYSGTPSNSRWEEYGNEGYQYTLEKLWNKFMFGHEYVGRTLEHADVYQYQLWSPYFPNGQLIDGLSELQDDFREDTGSELELILNEDFTDRVNELRDFAADTKKDYGAPAFRFLQILEHLR